MPLRRTCFVAGLHDLVFDGQPFREGGRLLAYGAVPLCEKRPGRTLGRDGSTLHVRGLEMLAIRRILQSLCQSDALSSGTLSATPGRGAVPANRGTFNEARDWIGSVAGFRCRRDDAQRHAGRL